MKRASLFCILIVFSLVLAAVLLQSLASAAILATSNGTIVFGAVSGSINQQVQGGSGGGSGGNSLSIVINPVPNASNSSNSSTPENFTITSGLGVAGSPLLGNTTGAVNTSTPFISTLEVNYTFNIASAAAGAQVWQDIAIPGMPLTRLAFVANENLSNITFLVRALGNRPSSTAELLNPSYLYLEVVKTNIQNSQIKDATLDFNVPISWITSQQASAQDVLLKRFTLSWEDLPTQLVKQDGGVASYEATLPGFSYFAIVLRRSGSGESPTGNVVGAGEGAGTAGNDSGFQLIRQETPAAAPAKSPGIGAGPAGFWFVAIAVVVLVGVFAYQKLAGAGVFDQSRAPRNTPLNIPPNILKAMPASQALGRAGQANTGVASSGSALARKLADLDAYVVKGRASGKGDAQIRQELLGVGWTPHVADLVLQSVHAPQPQAAGGAALTAYVRSSLGQGYSVDQVRMVLRRVGWNESAIDDAIARAVTGKGGVGGLQAG